MCPKSIKTVTNGIHVARHGLTFGEDEAMTSMKLFKHLETNMANTWPQRAGPGL